MEYGNSGERRLVLPTEGARDGPDHRNLSGTQDRGVKPDLRLHPFFISARELQE